MAKEGSGFRRRGGRWVADDPAKHPATDLDALAESNERLRGARRAGGRWVASGTEVVERHRILRGIISRLWLLAVPLIGILWANSSYVRPDLVDMDSAGSKSRASMLDHKDEIRVQIDALQTQVQTISAEIDTLHQPMIAFHQTLYDNLMNQRRERDAEPRITQATLDSLAAVRLRLATETESLQADYWNHASTLANLAAWQASLRDSIDIVEQQALAMETESQEEEEGRSLRTVVTRAGYILAPVLGYMWARDS